jgi:hypothetical protein
MCIAVKKLKMFGAVFPNGRFVLIHTGDVKKNPI